MSHTQSNDYYQDKLKEYAIDFKNKKLKSRGKIIEVDEPIYVIYARKSIKSDERQETSIQDQLAECTEFAEREGLNCVATIVEQKSAKDSGKRPEFAKMLKTIKEGKQYNSILSWAPDRLARNMKDGGEIIDLLDKQIIVDLKFPSFTFVPNETGKMTLGFQFIMAKQYVDNLKETTKRGNRRHLGRGETLGTSKDGYVTKNKNFRKDSNTFKHLQKAWQMIIDGNSIEETSDHLASEGLDFSPKKLSRLFQDPFYAGYFTYGNEMVYLPEIDTDFEIMVSPQEFMIARERIGERRGYITAREELPLFRRMVYCVYCDRVMTPYIQDNSKKKNSKRYMYLKCANDSCERKSEKSLKRQERAYIVLNFITKLLEGGLEVNKRLYSESMKYMVDSIEQERKSISKEIQINKTNITRLEKEIKELTSNMSKVSSDKALKGLNKDLEEKYEEKTMIYEKVTSLEAMFEKLYIESSPEAIPYERFSNLFKNIDRVLAEADDIFLIDQLVRMVFLNLTLGDGEVVSYQLNEPFKSYSKMPPPPNGVADGT